MTSHVSEDGITGEGLANALTALEIDSLSSIQVVKASHLAEQYYPRFDPGQALLVLGPATVPEMQRLEAALVQAYGPDHPVRAPGVAADALTVAKLPSLDGLSAGRYLFVPPRAEASTYETIQDIAAHLRAPEGCPWDRELTWAKLRANLLEETHELLAALDAGDARKVSEELGDLLLQVAMQTQIAAEGALFRFPDVVDHIVSKLIRRHPHVFGDAVVSGTEEVLANWEAIKRAERAENNERRSPLSGIPPGLPALAQADAYLDRMSRIREPEAPEAPWQALDAVRDGEPLPAELLGNVLFGLVAWARARSVDAESALREANARYAARVEEEQE